MEEEEEWDEDEKMMLKFLRVSNLNFLSHSRNEFVFLEIWS